MQSGTSFVGDVVIQTADHRGWTPQELADRAVERIIHVGDTSHPLVRDQARAFREHIRSILVSYLEQAQCAKRTTICAQLRQQGRADIADVVERL